MEQNTKLLVVDVNIIPKGLTIEQLLDIYELTGKLLIEPYFSSLPSKEDLKGIIYTNFPDERTRTQKD